MDKVLGRAKACHGAAVWLGTRSVAVVDAPPAASIPVTSAMAAVQIATRDSTFLGNPDKAPSQTISARSVSLFGHLKGASPGLLKIFRPESLIDERLCKSLTAFLRRDCGVVHAACILDAVKESSISFPIIQVNAYR